MDIAGHSDFERSRIMLGSLSCPPIEVDERHKTSRRTTNNTQIHWQAHGTSPSGAYADRERVRQRNECRFPR